MNTTGATDGDLRVVIYDPVRFARGLLRCDLWPVQAEILRAVAMCPRTAVKACHASGKTFVAAVTVLWWITRFRDGIVVTTAPTWTQVERVLWGEIHRIVRRSRIQFPALNQTELKIGPGNYAIGLSTNEGVRFQGFHGDHILIVLDEAPGVLPEIWEAIEGIRAGGDVRVLALGNPTVSSGPFYDAFTANREQWRTFTISGFDTPNLAGLSLRDVLALDEVALDVAPNPYLVTRRWVREKHYEWGENHPLWQARVMGEFPTQGDNALISLAWLEAAARRPAHDAGGEVNAGVDVAGPGEDETVLVVREGSTILRLQRWTTADARGEVVAALAPWRNRLETVNVDSAGIGYYLGKHLEDLNFPVRLVNVGQSSSDSDKYSNRKAEFYWSLRMRFQAGDVAGLTDEKTISQLASILYEHDARGRVAIESKDDARKRGVKSPDRAEAVMLAFAAPALGWTVLDYASDPDSPEDSSSPMGQLRDSLPPDFVDRDKDVLTCGECANFQPGAGGRGRCKLDGVIVTSDMRWCLYYDAP